MERKKVYLQSVNRALNWIENQIKDDGSLANAPKDIVCYYKLPSLFIQQGKEDLAKLILNFIQKNFMKPNGDFFSSDGLKTASPAFIEFWAYTNGWIVQAAQRLGRFDISYAGWKYLLNYFNSNSGGWNTHQILKADNPVDVFMTAHLGLTSLFMGDLDKAEKAGQFLQKIYDKQPSKSNKFYLRSGPRGELIKNYPTDINYF